MTVPLSEKRQLALSLLALGPEQLRDLVGDLAASRGVTVDELLAGQVGEASTPEQALDVDAVAASFRESPLGKALVAAARDPAIADLLTRAQTLDSGGSSRRQRREASRLADDLARIDDKTLERLVAEVKQLQRLEGHATAALAEILTRRSAADAATEA